MKKDNSNFRIFIYKTIFIFFCAYLLYNFTIGKKIDQYENNLLFFKTDQGRDILREKLRKEIEKSLDKESVLDPSDRVLLRKFVKKILNELEIN